MTISCSILHSVCDQIQNLQNCLTTPRQKPRRGGGRRQINSMPQSPFLCYLKEKEICIVFNESYSYPSTVETIPLLASGVGVGAIYEDSRKLVFCRYSCSVILFNGFGVPCAGEPTRILNHLSGQMVLASQQVEGPPCSFAK